MDSRRIAVVPCSISDNGVSRVEKALWGKQMSARGWPIFVFLLASVAISTLPSQSAHAYRFKSLYSFCSACNEGQGPQGGLVSDGSGNLYGATSSNVFELIANPTTGKFKERPINNRVGSSAPLLIDKSGNLYGTNDDGGDNNNGYVFKLVRDSISGRFQQEILYKFCRLGGSCTDGKTPSGGLAMDQSGNLFGTTVFGGAFGAGTVFELMPNAATGRYRERVLVSLCGGTDCTSDGNNPAAGVIIDGSGNLFGANSFGGSANHGSIFELVLNKATGRYRYKVLYTFCKAGGSPCVDGAGPSTKLALDQAGNLYGVASGGAFNHGVVFKLAPNPQNGRYRETVLYSFCPKGGSVCTDGDGPHGGLTIDHSGNLFGVTQFGGANNKGAVFELIAGARGRFVEKVLYSFCPGASCFDGQWPEGQLLLDSAENLYGTTFIGGNNNDGTAFELLNR